MTDTDYQAEAIRLVEIARQPELLASGREDVGTLLAAAQAYAILAIGETMAQLVEHWRQAAPDPTRQVPCPSCGQLVEPADDGTVPGHQIQPGPKRAPMCLFRGTVTLPEAGGQ